MSWEFEEKKWRKEKAQLEKTRRLVANIVFSFGIFLFEIAEFDEDGRFDLIREEILKHRQEVLEQEKKLDSLLALLDPNVSDHRELDAEEHT